MEWGNEKSSARTNEPKDSVSVIEARLMGKRIQGLLEMVVVMDKRGEFQIDTNGQLKLKGPTEIKILVNYMTSEEFKRSGFLTVEKLGDVEVTRRGKQQLVILKGKAYQAVVDPSNQAELTAYRTVMRQLKSLADPNYPAVDERINRLLTNSPFFERKK